MERILEYLRQPRADERTTKPPVRVADCRQSDHPNFIVRMNNRFGLRVTLAVGTMWCA
jgi:hypothetical protein